MRSPILREVRIILVDDLLKSVISEIDLSRIKDVYFYQSCSIGPETILIGDVLKLKYPTHLIKNNQSNQQFFYAFVELEAIFKTSTGEFFFEGGNLK